MRKSGIILGAMEDSAYIASQVVARCRGASSAASA